MYTLTDGHTSAKASPSTPASTSVRHDSTAAKDPRAGAAWIAGFTFGRLPDDALWPGRAGQSASSGSLPKVKPAIQAAPARGSFAAVLSWRTLVLAGVLGLAFALVWPSVRVYLGQRGQINDLTVGELRG